MFLCALLACQFSFPFLYAQVSSEYNITFRQLKQEDGLANRNVNAGLQDSRGFVWLGTKDGLNRYDGRNFQLFTKEKNGLQLNNVVSLCEDSDNKIWILYGVPGVNTTSGGKIDFIDVKSSRIVPFHKYFKSPPFAQGQVIAMAANRSHEIFIYCDDGFVYLYGGDKKFRKLNATPLNRERGPHFVFINHATDSGMWLRYDRFVGKRGQVIDAPHYHDGYLAMNFEGEDKLIMMYLGVDRVLNYNNSKIIEVTQEGVHDYTDKLSDDIRKQFYRMCKSDYYMVLRDYATSSTVIQNLNTGIYLYRDRQMIPLLDSVECKKLPSLSITNVFSDHEGKLWICTNIGVMIFKISVNRFTHYLSSEEYTVSGVRTNYQTRGIHADTNGNILIGTTTGAYHIKEDKSQKVIEKINPETYISPMVNDGDNYYFGQRHLFQYNIRTGIQKVLLDVRDYNIIWNVYKIDSNKWWLSNQTDFFLVKDGVFNKIKDLRTGAYLKHVWIHQFFKDKKGDLWAVGSKGLYKMLNDSVAGEHYGTAETDRKYKLPFDDFHCIYEDGEGSFWMATDGDGLYKWIRDKHTFLHFTIADGLSSNILYGILEDENGFLWISSDNGLMRFNKSDFNVKTYSVRDGITNNEFNRLSYFKAANGRMYFGGVDGVNAFYPKDFRIDNQQFAAPLRVTSYHQFDAASDRLEERTTELLETNTITLNPGDNFFTFEFSLLDFEIGKHRYAYKIDGIDKDWIYVDENRLRISSPKYGDYTLKVKAQNNEGEWSSSEISIPLHVVTPFYKRTGFFVTCIIIAMLLVVTYIRYRLWYYKRRNLTLENVISNRTQELKTSLEEKDVLLKEIHHRVKNNLQVISSLLQLQSQSVTDKGAKDALIEGHNRVLSIALIHQKLYQNEKVDTVEFAVFADELFYQVNSLYLVNTRVVKFENKLPRVNLPVDIAVPLGLILNELMTNSFKYAFNDNGTLSIIRLQLEYSDDYTSILYSDSGKGLPDNWKLEQTTSLGIKLIKRLTQQLHGRVAFFNDDGANFMFSFPTDYFHS